MSAAPVRLIPTDRAPEPLKFKFTIRNIERIGPAPDRQVWVYDEDTSGLALLILPSGVRSFYFAKRIDGRYRRVSLGKFPDITIEQARKLAAKHLGKVADGENPADARRQARAASTLADLFDYYLRAHAKVHKRTWQEDQRQYDRHLKRWAGRRLDQIARAEVAALHARIGKEAPIAANRVLALLSKLFNVAAGVGFAGSNPAKGVQRFSEQQRDRFLDADELPRFLAAVGEEPHETTRDYLRVVLFTGQRRENVASMRWDEIDLHRRVWTIPADKFKTGNAVDIPIVPAVVDILTTRRQLDPDGEWVFSARRHEAKTPHLSEPKTGFKRVCERAGIKALRLHDLRRTTASWATMIGTPYPVVARMVGHKAQGVTSIYARFDLQAVRDAFEKTVAAMLATTGKAATTAAGKKGGAKKKPRPKK